MAVNLGTIYASLGLRMDRFVQAKKQAEVHITAIERRMAEMEEASNTLAQGVLAVGAAMGAAGMYAITMAAQMEQSKIAFGTLLGSGEKAKEFLDDLAQFAARTPFDLKGLKQSSRMLLAFGFQAQEIIPMMTAVGDSIGALGGGTFEIQRVVRALGQMRAKGKVSAEEMRQIAELGVPAWDMLAEQIGVSVPEAMKLAEQGAIDGLTGVNAIVAGMGQRFEGAMDRQSESVLGMWSTIVDNVQISAGHLGGILIEAFDISDHMKATIEALDEMRITMEAFAKVVTERGLSAAVTELFGPGTTLAVLSLGGAILGGLVPAIYAATKALWLKFAALAALKPWLLAGAAAGGLMAAHMIRQTEATRGSNKSLQDHIAELRRQQTSTDRSTAGTQTFSRALRNTGAAARTAGREVANAAREAQDAVQGATRRIDRLHDALVNALRRKYTQERDIALRNLSEIYQARRRIIEQQLDALDEGARREDHTREMAEKQDELSLLQRELAYETDARRRADIQNRIAELQKTIGDKTRRFERDNERKRLQDQLETLSTEETNAKTSAETMWEQRLSDARLGGEAEKLIIGQNQTAILALLRTYGDGWRDIGATFGQRLVEGMGPYPMELRNMVTAALSDIRAAADGTMARLREVAAAAQGAVVSAGAGIRGASPTAPRVANQPPRLPQITPTRQNLSPIMNRHVRPSEVSEMAGRPGPVIPLIDRIRAPFEQLLSPLATQVRQTRETVAGAVRAAPSFAVAGPMVQVQSMTIRQEADIEAVSRALHRQIQASTTARGRGRGR